MEFVITPKTGAQTTKTLTSSLTIQSYAQIYEAQATLITKAADKPVLTLADLTGAISNWTSLPSGTRLALQDPTLDLEQLQSTIGSKTLSLNVMYADSVDPITIEIDVYWPQQTAPHHDDQRVRINRDYSFSLQTQT